jgi:metallophosphoesterase (TIGR03767 family)
VSTHRRALVGGEPNEGGYRTLSFGPGEPHVLRTDLYDVPAGAPGALAAAASAGEVLLASAHLSDLHVCDSQSPARVEFLDRFADPDSALLEHLEEVGAYRAQELLTVHVVDAMVRAVNSAPVAPVSGSALQLGILTGDLTDNAQSNELSWYLALLDGGELHPDSGNPERYEGISDDVEFDERYWHPDGTWPDRPRSIFGFPRAPGLLDAMRRPFVAPGLALPWLAVHGNHDQMLQGTVPAMGLAARVATGTRKPISVPAEWSTDEVLALFAGLDACDPSAIARVALMVSRSVTGDRRRRTVTRQEFILAHLRATARPAGHGFSPQAAVSGRAYYRHDHGELTLLVLDTVNENGGWQGSLDVEQLSWLQDELAAADRERRHVVLASHHPLETMVNDRPGAVTGRRVLGTELQAVLAAHPSVVLWLNGHTHETTVTPHGSWWEVTAPSLIDWPQQGRIVELIRHDGVLTIATTMIDHSGEAPWSGAIRSVDEIAGLSRELAANDWQWRQKPLEEHPRGGGRADRNALLLLADPFS